jgi:hypothetical protein
MRLRLVVRVASVLVLGSVTCDAVLAEPDATCRAFAKQFSEKPETLDTSTLARLRTCVSRELELKLATDRSAADVASPKLPAAK